MTKRIKAKHKVDRRLKLIYGGNQKAHLIPETILQDNMVKTKKENPQIMVFSLMLNKN